ncbi:hypothetical protein J6590_094870 [Homalodisca vitripennis]|nr:hypothetical protein J6590_094870 [Homalodisca vitripennis]
MYASFVFVNKIANLIRGRRSCDLYRNHYWSSESEINILILNIADITVVREHILITTSDAADGQPADGRKHSVGRIALRWKEALMEGGISVRRGALRWKEALVWDRADGRRHMGGSPKEHSVAEPADGRKHSVGWIALRWKEALVWNG